MVRRQYSEKVRSSAATLVHMVESGKHTGITWTWEYIGTVLGLTPAQARQVIYYLREHNDDFVWTVGTYASGYTTMPTSSSTDALDGIINQYRHALTRERSQEKVWSVLAKVDPDPKWSKFAKRESRWWERKAADTRDHLEHLIDEHGLLAT